MRSSNRFGRGGATAARPRVQVRPAHGAESGTVIPTEQQIGLGRESELLAHHFSDVDGERALGQRIESGIVDRVRVAGEHGGVHVDVHVVQYFGETATALTANHPVDVAAPQILAVTGGLQLSLYRHRAFEPKSQPIERGVPGLEPSLGPDGTPENVSNVNSQHSRLR